VGAPGRRDPGLPRLGSGGLGLVRLAIRPPLTVALAPLTLAVAPLVVPAAGAGRLRARALPRVRRRTGRPSGPVVPLRPDPRRRRLLPAGPTELAPQRVAVRSLRQAGRGYRRAGLGDRGDARRRRGWGRHRPPVGGPGFALAGARG